MCYKIETQKKNEEKLLLKLNELAFPVYLRKYFTVRIESKAGSLKYLIVITDLLNWFIEEKLIDKTSISEIEPSDFNNIIAEDITLYLRTKEQNGLSPTTLETRKNIIRSFWNFLSRQNGTNIPEKFFLDVTYKGISCSNGLTKKLPMESQIKNLEERLNWIRNDFIKNRNVAIFLVMQGTGIRESELAGLNFSDLHFNEDMPYITVIGKGKYREAESRMVYLTETAFKALNDWIDFRKNLKIDIMDEEAVFISKYGKRIVEADIYKFFKKYSNGELTPHMMRHWYASIVGNINTVFCQQQLGHSNMATTINVYANGSVAMKDVLKNM